MTCNFRITFHPSDAASTDDRQMMEAQHNTVLPSDELLSHLLTDGFIRSLDSGAIHRVEITHTYGSVTYQCTVAPVTGADEDDEVLDSWDMSALFLPQRKVFHHA